MDREGWADHVPIVRTASPRAGEIAVRGEDFDRGLWIRGVVVIVDADSQHHPSHVQATRLFQAVGVILNEPVPDIAPYSGQCLPDRVRFALSPAPAGIVMVASSA